MTRSLATGALQISPPLIIDTTGLEELRTRIESALDHVTG